MVLGGETTPKLPGVIMKLPGLITQPEIAEGLLQEGVKSDFPPRTILDGMATKEQLGIGIEVGAGIGADPPPVGADPPLPPPVDPDAGASTLT